ncbi:MAG: 50S ribosomal protein L21 [Candidatus Omnitrophica bacterium]|nr:50S ribosomal protein L21 [Candidatus Omnitrophota bacterium]
MYAIIAIGGKQYNVKEGDVIEVEKQDAEKDSELVIDNVLLTVEKDDVQIGQPFVKEAKVVTEVLGATKGEKVISFKYRKRKSSHWKKGHRQQLTKLRIKAITVG